MNRPEGESGWATVLCSDCDEPIDVVIIHVGPADGSTWVTEFDALDAFGRHVREVHGG